MKSAVVVLAFGIGALASAIVPHILPRATVPDSWVFTLIGHGPGGTHSANGVLGQLFDGQNRIGGHLPLGKYHIKDGKVWDEHNRGCILTPPTTQWQCDEGAEPSGGFSLGCNGKLTHDGSDVFHACPVNDEGEWNIYKYGAPGQKKCVQITITTKEGAPDSCKPKPAPSPPALAPTPTPTPSKSPCGGKGKPSCKCSDKDENCKPPCKCSDKGDNSKPSCHDTGNGHVCSAKYRNPCGLDLSGDFEFPHLIIPVDKTKPNAPLGNQLNGTVAPGICSLFDFDIKPAHAGKLCSLVFLFPEQKDLETSAFEMSGHGSLVFSFLSTPAGEKTTWNNKGKATSVWTSEVQPGSSYHVLSLDCPAGLRLGVEVCQTGDFALNYFQDFNPKPIGLFVEVC